VRSKRVKLDFRDDGCEGKKCVALGIASNDGYCSAL
jgi:hypothetical protein